MKPSISPQLLQTAEQLRDRVAALRPFPEETLKSLREYYRIGLTYSSNALEGNSLTESETKVVIENGLTIEGTSCGTNMCRLSKCRTSHLRLLSISLLNESLPLRWIYCVC